MNATDTVVRKTVTVAAPRERAFAVFTEGMTGWWPIATHTIGAVPIDAVVLEPRDGGRWYERGVDGSECDWGHVRAWEPPARIVLVWQLNAGWRFDPAIDTEVEVRFVAEDESTTRVELEHRGLEAFGPATEEMRGAFDSPGGWGGLLATYAEQAAGA
jgi:uncharacterized protein YndB with AHSA1/START domain